MSASDQTFSAAPEEFVPGESSRVPVAPAGKRYVGYCRSCHDFVEVTTTFTCAEQGHPKSDMAVALLIDADEKKPHIPRLNLGALFMPALWGPGHGQWFMILFYPLWIFLDNMIYGAVHGNGMGALAIGASLVTAAITVFYALNANRHGYLRVASEKTPEEYVRGERVWTVAMVVVGVAFLVFASWYNIAVRPGME